MAPHDLTVERAGVAMTKPWTTGKHEYSWPKLTRAWAVWLEPFKFARCCPRS